MPGNTSELRQLPVRQAVEIIGAHFADNAVWKYGIDFLMAVQKSSPTSFPEVRRARFENALAREPYFDGLSTAEFAVAAREVLQQTARDMKLPLIEGYQGTKPDLEDRTACFPLSKDEVRDLLSDAKLLAERDARAVANIVVRLGAAIEGVHGPQRDSRSLERRKYKLHEAFWRGYQHADLDELAQTIFMLLKSK